MRGSKARVESIKKHTTALKNFESELLQVEQKLYKLKCEPETAENSYQQSILKFTRSNLRTSIQASQNSIAHNRAMIAKSLKQQIQKITFQTKDGVMHEFFAEASGEDIHSFMEEYYAGASYMLEGVKSTPPLPEVKN